MPKRLVADGDKVLLKPVQETSQIVGNIVIPDMGKEKAELGEIISIGPGLESLTGNFIPTHHKVGDIVLMPKFGTQAVSYGGEDYLVVAEKELLAHVEDVPEPEYDYDDPVTKYTSRSIQF